MGALLRPFSGFLPSADYGSRVVGPSTSLLSPEQKDSARDDELSFRHRVGRGAQAPHAEAMDWLRHCIDAGALQTVDSAVAVHRSTFSGFSGVGLLADVSLAAYDAGLIRRHEATIEKTQAKMIDYMQSTRIYGNPVALGHRDDPMYGQSLSRVCERIADIEFESIAGTHHELWIVEGAEARALCDAVSDALYIADGHHRIAAAAALATAEGRADAHLPAAVFGEAQLRLGAFARVVEDDAAVSSDVLAALQARFDMYEVNDEVPRPSERGQIGVRANRRSFLLTVPARSVPADVYGRLDVNLLQQLILEPLFGIADPRADSRLSFVADTATTTHRVDSCTAWFLPHPALVSDVMAVADSGRSMPPKSTYFMPKVPSGLLVRPIDEISYGT